MFTHMKHEMLCTFMGLRVLSGLTILGMEFCIHMKGKMLCNLFWVILCCSVLPFWACPSHFSCRPSCFAFYLVREMLCSLLRGYVIMWVTILGVVFCIQFERGNAVQLLFTQFSIRTVWFLCGKERLVCCNCFAFVF